MFSKHRHYAWVNRVRFTFSLVWCRLVCDSCCLRRLYNSANPTIGTGRYLSGSGLSRIACCQMRGSTPKDVNKHLFMALPYRKRVRSYKNNSCLTGRRLCEVVLQLFARHSGFWEDVVDAQLRLERCRLCVERLDDVRRRKSTCRSVGLSLLYVHLHLAPARHANMRRMTSHNVVVVTYWSSGSSLTLSTQKLMLGRLPSRRCMASTTFCWLASTSASFFAKMIATTPSRLRVVGMQLYPTA